MSDLSLVEKIWFAGLGALARAEKQDEVWLEELIEDGRIYEESRKDDINQSLKNLSEQTDETQSKMRHRFADIEASFENKVSETLHHLGLASKKDINALKKRLKNIEENIES